MMRAFLLSACLLATAQGHGQLTWPPSTRHGGSVRIGADCGNGACFWFSNNVEVDAPALPAAMRSLEPDVESRRIDVYRANPWRAPGKAAVYGSGCGVAGGHPTEEYANGGIAPTNFPQGFDGAQLSKAAGTLGAAKWVQGGVAELAWAMSANHGGGYAYRLCPADEPGGITESCFQRRPLRFADSNTSFVLYPNGTRVALPRAVTTTGTHTKPLTPTP